MNHVLIIIVAGLIISLIIEHERNKRKIAKLEKRIEESLSAINQSAEINSLLKKENIKLKEQLAYYTEIEADSKEINDTEDSKAQAELLNKLKENESNQTKSGVNIVEEKKHEGNQILDDEQEAAFSLMMNTNSNYCITGKAGTGKSFLLAAFIGNTKKKVLVLAPTGIAALNVGGVTIHSAFGYDNLVKLSVDDIRKGTISLNDTKRNVLKQVNTIIIDEISMVRVDVLEKINKILQVINNNDLLFGGKQMLFFGDLFQLPPVAKKDEVEFLVNKYGGVFFFHSPAYKNANFKFVELSVNHRQEGDKPFFDLLNRVREGKATKADLEMLNSRKLPTTGIRRILTLFPKKDKAEDMNREELAKIPGKEYVYMAEVVLQKNGTQTPVIENVFPVLNELRIKVGALVMMVANDPEKRWVNGTIGIVQRLENDAVFVAINGQTYEIYKYKFTMQEAKYNPEEGIITYEDVFGVEQYPIVLAYAITIHKSQGMTYQRLACDISHCFAPGQAYVALSRCSSFKGLYLLNDITPASLKVDSDVREYYYSQVS